MRTGFRGRATALFPLLLGLLGAIVHGSPGPWKRHSIDHSSKGADGVRLADLNGDGRLDIVTGWEQGGLVRVCLQPEKGALRKLWPSFTVGRAPNVEDAVFFDADGDGNLDVISCCEGETRAMFVHWAPAAKESLLDADAWKTERIPASHGTMMWMFAAPALFGGGAVRALVAGGKGTGAQLGLWLLPGPGRELKKWQWIPLREVGWVMSIALADMDGDLDEDIVFTDRKGPRRGCYWLENPGTDHLTPERWREHVIGARRKEAMFLSFSDLDQDGRQDVLVACQPAEILYLRRLSDDGRRWAATSISLPAHAGMAKSVAAGDLDLDGKLDLVFTTEKAENGKQGVMRLSYGTSPMEPNWTPFEISGVDGVKHDLVELLDLDGDGDLDVVTCEEARNLGVIWYENPLRPLEHEDDRTGRE